jgi:hypothetical protein
LLLETSLIAGSGIAAAAAPTRQLSIPAPHAPQQDPPSDAPTDPSTPETAEPAPSPAAAPTLAFVPTETVVFTVPLTETSTL